MKKHLVVQFIASVPRTHYGKYMDVEWVTGNKSEVSCLRCQKASVW